MDVKLLTLNSGTIDYLGTQFPLLHDDVRRVFRNTIPKLKGWRRTVDLERKVETNQRRMDECTNRLTTEDVNSFFSSPVVISAKKIFTKAKEKWILNCNEMCAARDSRDYLITLKTGTHPGALKNLKMQEYYDAKTDATTGHNCPLYLSTRGKVMNKLLCPLMLSLMNYSTSKSKTSIHNFLTQEAPLFF